MKRPEGIVGFITISGIDYPFEYDDEEWMLSLFPPTEEIWRKSNNLGKLFEKLTQDTKKHEWVTDTQLIGKTSNHNHVVFSIQAYEEDYQGFTSYKVNWYFYYTEPRLLDKIDGFKVANHDVDYFYSPMHAISPCVEYHEDGKGIKEMTVSGNDVKPESCGRYRVAKKIDAEMEVSAYSSIHIGIGCNPMSATSQLVTTFSEPVNLDVLISAYHKLILFFMYITYRQNVDIGDAEVFVNNNEGLRESKGILCFPTKVEKEKHKDAKKQIIPYSLLSGKSAKLFTQIKNKKLGLQHICTSIEDRRHYPASRIIMILSGFEREYLNIYGRNGNRSMEFMETRNELICVVDRYIKEQKGKKRRCAKEFKRVFQNMDNSFTTNVMTALMATKTILEPSVKPYYKGTFEEAAHGISERMGAVRNGIAHSRLDLRLDAIHLCDIKIIEKLIYAMRLKRLRLSNDECQTALKNLFN